jgi:F-type H+-transporting ATPase subunit delta
MSGTSAKFTRPYVDAFFAIAKDPGAELLALEEFRRVFDLAPELGKALSNPGLERGKREAILASVVSRAGVPVLAARLLTILLHNGRLSALGELLAAIRARLDHDTRSVEARIVTAQPADAAVLESLRALVAARTGKTVRLVSAVDPALLGGFVVSVGSARLDASLARRLEKARAALHALAPA